MCGPEGYAGGRDAVGRGERCCETMLAHSMTLVEASHLRWMLKHDPDLMESFVQQALSDLNRTEANCAALFDERIAMQTISPAAYALRKPRQIP
jgi:hypothetical protein